MHAAKLANSARLRATLLALQRGPATTAWLAAVTGSCAVHSDIAELRANGVAVACRLLRVTPGTRRRVYEYRLANAGGDASASSPTASTALLDGE